MLSIFLFCLVYFMSNDFFLIFNSLFFMVHILFSTAIRVPARLLLDIIVLQEHPVKCGFYSIILYAK